MDDDEYNTLDVYKNTKRGLSFKFGKMYTDMFCNEKHVQAIIRAHEFNPGSEFKHTPDMKVFTVFSSINYGMLANISNKSAIVYIHDKYEETNGKVIDMLPIIFRRSYNPLLNPYDKDSYNGIRGKSTLKIIKELHGMMYGHKSVLKSSSTVIETGTSLTGNIVSASAPVASSGQDIGKIPPNEMNDVSTKADDIESDVSDINQDHQRGLEEGDHSQCL